MASRRKARGLGLAVLSRLAGSRVLDRWGLRRPVERVVFRATRTGFRTAGAATRAFTATTRLVKPARLPTAPAGDLFDLTPTDDQQMMRAIAGEFAAEQLRPSAVEADAQCQPPVGLLKKS